MEAFKKAVVVLDTKYLLPVRIALISPDNKSSKDFRVKHIVPNAKVHRHLVPGSSPQGVEADPKSQCSGADARELRSRGWSAGAGPGAASMNGSGVGKLGVLEACRGGWAGATRESGTAQPGVGSLTHPVGQLIITPRVTRLIGPAFGAHGDWLVPARVVTTGRIGSDSIAGPDHHAVVSENRSASDSRRESDSYESLPCRTSHQEGVAPSRGTPHEFGWCWGDGASPSAEADKTPAQFFPVIEPITSETIARIRAATRQLVDSLGQAGKAADPGVRVSRGRDRAGHQRVRRLSRPRQPDLPGTLRRQADRRLRASSRCGDSPSSPRLHARRS